jgi:hypothetical protein
MTKKPITSVKIAGVDVPVAEDPYCPEDIAYVSVSGNDTRILTSPTDTYNFTTGATYTIMYDKDMTYHIPRGTWHISNTNVTTGTISMIYDGDVPEKAKEPDPIFNEHGEVAP